MREPKTKTGPWLVINNRRDVARATVITSVIAVTASWIITGTLMFLLGRTGLEDLVIAFAICTLAPLAVAPPVSYKVFRLMLALQHTCSEVERLSRTDDLTQTFNRRYFMEMARRELALAGRHDYMVSLLLMDLDSFKGINDQMGHLAGDRALAACASLIQGTIRQGDVLGRFGGDEFLVLAPHTGLDSAAYLAERIRGAMAEAGIMVGGRRVRVRLSVGVVSTEQGAAKPDELLKRADQALYRAKELGGDRTELAA